MRLIDIVFRQGHLSERALVDAIVAGERPDHLDRCDICAERADLLARWMDEWRTDAADLADEVFTPERLQAQQQQVLRRLEQLDHPARVIAFPAASRPESTGPSGRRVAVSWVGVAAAAGLIIGVISGQISARMTNPVAPAAAVTTTGADATVGSNESTLGPVDESVLSNSYETLEIQSLAALGDMTPKVTQVAIKR